MFPRELNDTDALNTLGDRRGGVIDTAWPGEGPEEPLRDALREPGWARQLAGALLRELASEALEAEARAVRANLFVKSPSANWMVPWHQDRVVCVARREEVPGFSAWSLKGGLPHANAPVDVLRKMLAVRVHLDACTSESGALEVVPSTHNDILTSAEIAAFANGGEALEMAAGEVLLMRPLLLHRSRAMRRSTSRRVLHVEFASEALPTPLRWHYF